MCVPEKSAASQGFCPLDSLYTYFNERHDLIFSIVAGSSKFVFCCSRNIFTGKIGNFLLSLGVEMAGAVNLDIPNFNI